MESPADQSLTAALAADPTIDVYLAAGLPREPVLAVLNAVRHAATPLLLQGEHRAALSVATDVGERALTEVRAERRRLQVVEPAVECARGCSACCHLRVEISALEADLLLARAHDLNLVDALESRAAAVGSLSKADRIRAHVPCSFLGAEGECRAHDVRPLACRAANSLSRAACHVNLEQQDADAPIPVDAIWLVLVRAARVGLLLACSDAGISADLHELHTAVTRAAGRRS